MNIPAHTDQSQQETSFNAVTDRCIFVFTWLIHETVENHRNQKSKLRLQIKLCVIQNELSCQRSKEIEHNVIACVRIIAGQCLWMFSQTVPFLKVRVVSRVVFVTGLLQSVVEVKSIFFIDINWSQVCSSTKPPLFIA